MEDKPRDEELESTELASTQPTETPPDGTDRIGPYRLLEKLGEGGMGEVWLAEQKEPVRRKVALKVIKLGMDTRQVIARFEAERQALALMDHPNIARVLDAGATDQGRPYFVMEVVRGTPITDHCDRHLLTTRERLELFEQVCDGVQHAHQKAVIHRDLKPSNVLVVEKDGKRTPKIIDFGVAKATGQRLTEKTLHTALGAMVGTPAYMSPEQAASGAEDIDTRTDVYSLGVLLYQLLVGAMPFDPGELRNAGYEAIRRKIIEDEPSRPSTRLTTLGDDATESARRRRVDRSTLQRLLQGDLDWITMRALEKDRARRYGSPSALGADVRRYLDNEPVSASPPSTWYRVRKFARRHRVGVSVAVAGIVLLAASATTLAVQNRRIAAERDRANLESQVSERVSETLAEVLGSVNPATMGSALWEDLRERVAETSAARDETAGRQEETLAAFDHALSDINPTDVALKWMDEQILRHAAETTSRTLAEDRLIAGRLEAVMSESYRMLGLLDRAETHALRSVELTEKEPGEEDGYTYAARLNLVMVYLAQGRHDEAEPLVLSAIDGLGRTVGLDHGETARARSELARVRQAQGRYDEAERLTLEAVDALRNSLGAEHRETLWAMNNLVVLYTGQGRYDDAEPLGLELLDLRRRVLGEDHPDTLWSGHNLAYLYSEMGRDDEAETFCKQTFEARRRVLGEDHPDTLFSLALLATVLNSLGRYEESERVGLDVVERRRRVHGPSHPSTLYSVTGLASTYWFQERLDKAEPLYREVFETCTRTLGAAHPHTLGAMGNLALLYSRQRRRTDAEKLYLDILDVLLAEIGEEHPTTLNTKRNLGLLYRDTGRLDEAEPLIREVRDIRTKQLGRDNRESIMSDSQLASVYRLQGRYDESAEISEEALARARQHLGSEHALTISVLTELFRGQRARGRQDDAEALATERLELTRNQRGELHLHTLLWRARVADVWRRQGRFDEARAEFRRILSESEELPGNGRKVLLSFVHYYRSCLYAARNEPDEALELLRQGIDAGFTNNNDLRSILEDPHLSSLGGDPRFDSLIAKIRSAIAGDDPG